MNRSGEGSWKEEGLVTATWCFQLDFVTHYIYPALSGFFWFGFASHFFPFPFLSFLCSITADWFSKQGEVASQFSHFVVSFLHSAEHGMLGVYQGMQLQLGTGYGSLAWSGFDLTQRRWSDSVVL